MSKPLLLVVISFAALFTQGCLGGLFPLVAVPALVNRPEACASCQVEAATADRLADAIPGWMEESRALAGPSATAERTGHFSWKISLEGQPVSECGARVRVGWHCDLLLGTPLLAPL